MGASRKTREEILEEERIKWEEEVKDSGIPSELAEVYGVPHINIPPEEEEH